jgi:hypothetical protein
MDVRFEPRVRFDQRRLPQLDAYGGGEQQKKFGGGGGEMSISAIQPVSISAF